MALAEEEPHPAVGEHALLHGESLLVVPPGDPADVALCDTLGLLHTSSTVQHNMRWTVPRQPRVAESAAVHQCTALQYTGVPSALHCIPRPGSGVPSLTGQGRRGRESPNGRNGFTMVTTPQGLYANLCKSTFVWNAWVTHALYLKLIPKGANVHLLAHPLLIERAHLQNKYCALKI